MVDIDSCFGALGFSIKVLMGFRIELLSNLSEVSACACVLGIEPSELCIVRHYALSHVSMRLVLKVQKKTLSFFEH